MQYMMKTATHICIHTRTHTCMYIYIHKCSMYVCICICVCVCVCVCVCMYVCICMSVCLYVCICMSVCMYVYIYMYMYVCMFGWMDGCMDVWMYGCMYGWMDDDGRYTCVFFCRSFGIIVVWSLFAELKQQKQFKTSKLPPKKRSLDCFALFQVCQRWFPDSDWDYGVFTIYNKMHGNPSSLCCVTSRGAQVIPE